VCSLQGSSRGVRRWTAESGDPTARGVALRQVTAGGDRTDGGEEWAPGGAVGEGGDGGGVGGEYVNPPRIGGIGGDDDDGFGSPQSKYSKWAERGRDWASGFPEMVWIGPSGR
jgi:hypothetical protein